MKFRSRRTTCTDMIAQADTGTLLFLRHKAETTSSHGVSKACSQSCTKVQAPGAALQAPSASQKESWVMEQSEGSGHSCPFPQHDSSPLNSGVEVSSAKEGILSPVQVARVVRIQLDVQSTRVRSYKPWYAPKLSLDASSPKFVLAGPRVHQCVASRATSRWALTPSIAEVSCAWADLELSTAFGRVFVNEP